MSLRVPRLYLVLGIAGVIACAKPVDTLTPLASTPDWSRLEGFHETMTREDFRRLLGDVYAPDQAAQGLITVEADRALITKRSHGKSGVFELRFASELNSAKAVPRYWRPTNTLATNKEKPLQGIKIALDPGHLGGEWAKMEGRWFQVDQNLPVVEGEMTFRVAELMRDRLHELGAEVFLVRNSISPLTALRPEHLTKIAEENLRKRNAPTQEATVSPEPPDPAAVLAEGERLFYRVGEIRERTRFVNESIRPDLTICIHFNAGEWGDPQKPEFSKENHLHLLVNGAYSPEELAYDDVRLEMLIKLLSGSHAEELAVSETVAAAMAKETKLPPCSLPGLAVKKIGASPYIWARNLLANRQYQSPTLFLEPYVMNNEEVFARVQMGEYKGERRVGQVLRKNIYQEYADAVVEGLVNYYRPKS